MQKKQEELMQLNKENLLTKTFLRVPLLLIYIFPLIAEIRKKKRKTFQFIKH